MKSAGARYDDNDDDGGDDDGNDGEDDDSDTTCEKAAVDKDTERAKSKTAVLNFVRMNR